MQPEDRREALQDLLAGPVPHVIEVAGDSMGPSLERGWKVRVVPLTGAITPGDVVLLRAASGWVVHRALGETTFRGQRVLGHVGDSPGALPGVVPVGEVLGKGVAVVLPHGVPWPALAGLPETRRRAFERARRSFRRATRLWSLAERLGVFRVGRPVGAYLRRLGLAPSFGAPVARLQGTVSLRLALPAAARPAPPEVAIREIHRRELAETFRRGGLPAPDLDEVDRSAQAPWRAFGAFRGELLVHHSFVALRARGPLLFRAYTRPAFRGQGVFGALVGFVAATLAEEGTAALLSSCSWRNLPSLRAHEAAGFVVEARRFDIRVAGISLRAALGFRR